MAVCSECLKLSLKWPKPLDCVFHIFGCHASHEGVWQARVNVPVLVSGRFGLKIRLPKPQPLQFEAGGDLGKALGNYGHRVSLPWRKEV